MRSLRYLNSVLTIIAVLLTLQLWTLWTATPAAPSLDAASTARAEGIPDSGAQRKEIIAGLKEVNGSIRGLTGLFQSGQARVRVEEPGEVKKTDAPVTEPAAKDDVKPAVDEPTDQP